jgi:rod shape-determining protein MreD
MRSVPYIIYLILLASFEVIIRDVVTIWYAAPNLAALLVLAVALHQNEITALWFGLLAGIVLSAGEPSHVGSHALSLAALALAAYHARQRLNLEAISAKMLVMFSGVLVHNIITLAVIRADNLPLRLADTALTGTVYTSIIAYIFFLIKEEHITAEKFRELF